MSISANELRLGSIVNLKDKGLYIIDCGHDIEELEGWYGTDYLTGVALTDGILEGLGFQSYNHFTVTNSKFIDLGRNRKLTIGCAGTPNEMVWLSESDNNDNRMVNDLICLRNYDYDGKTYAHHIQNLYHSLTGNELTLNKPF